VEQFNLKAEQSVNSVVIRIATAVNGIADGEGDIHGKT
jgi:hypothetical protein